MESIRNGQSAQEVLDMPYQYMLELFAEKAKPQRASSFFELLG